MNIPSATYRLQINGKFTFRDAQEILPYLSQLGISHVYCSPIFKARRGSSHGYDVTDPNLINDEIGNLTGFKKLTAEAKAHGLQWVQDIVPNHMSYSSDNKMIMDIFERGASSKYRDFFDVDWNHPSAALKGKILAPFLERGYYESLAKGDVRLTFENGFKIRYNDLEFPAKLDTYRRILSSTDVSAELMDKKGKDIKKILENKPNKKLIAKIIQKHNGDTRLLDELLSAQEFNLAPWAMASEEINYRRFFAVNELIAVRMEQSDVLQETHRLILKLIHQRTVSGLRIDHIDGLYDPGKYLETLRSKAPQVYMIVEKILEFNKDLPASWPIQGTTGYDFLNYVNQVFVVKNNERKVNAIFTHFTKVDATFKETLRRCKRLVLESMFNGEVDNLTRMFHKILGKRPYGQDCTFQRLRMAVAELLISFPVYRTYFSKDRRDKKDSNLFEEALLRATQAIPEALYELQAIGKILDESLTQEDALQCIMRLQQFTGAVMAKGLEDTAFYVYNRFLSLNEVGGNPDVFGISTYDFHDFNEGRRNTWPFSLNSTSTHDTKRGEDVRARLNVLSEIPSKFEFQIEKWTELNVGKKKKIDGKLVPQKNEEYYIYQTLLGSFPFDPDELQHYSERIKAHMIKALREAKVNSSWLRPNLEYERAVSSFVSDILDASSWNSFLQDFLRFQKKIAFYGIFNSLSQTLLKISSPGIPDFYQGAELWDLNLVDPDNRRSVDFLTRKRLLKEIQWSEQARPEKVGKALGKFDDGRIKLFEIYNALNLRKEKKRVFDEGDYIPLKTSGKYEDHVIAFLRRRRRDWIMTATPRFLTSLVEIGELPLDHKVWKDTCVCIPANAPDNWDDVFTRRRLHSIRIRGKKRLEVADLFRIFPSALILGSNNH